MKKIALTVALFAASMGATMAHASDLTKDISVGGAIHGASEYNFRGQDFSGGEPSLGGQLKLTHKSGVYGALTADTIKIRNLDNGRAEWDQGQALVTLTGGYNFSVNPDLTLGAGLKHNAFTGKGSVSDASFSEMFVAASYKGLHGSLSTVISGADRAIAGLNDGDVYGEVGYTHKIGKWDLGGDLGYAWYSSDSIGAKDGETHTTLRVGYQWNNNLHVGVAYQLDNGKDGYNKSTGNGGLRAKVSYAFN